MEVALVVEAGERVGLGELPRLAVPARVLDRGHRALGQALGLLDLVRVRLVVALPPEERKRPDRPELATDERNEDAAANERVVGDVLVTAVPVGDGDRPGEGARDARGRRLRRLLRRHPARRDGGRAALALDDHHRGVDSHELHRGVEDAVDDLLEVDRPTELAEEPVSARLALGAVERLREVVRHRVHLRAHLVDGTHELGALCSRIRRAPPGHEEPDSHRQHAAAMTITAVITTTNPSRCRPGIRSDQGPALLHLALERLAHCTS